jgi:uncharacterized protein (DUF58 family)
MTKSHALLMRAKKGLATQLSGNHLSFFRGSGSDIVQLREYQEGDEIRLIDWKISAKMDQLYVKITQEERVIPVVIVPLMSGSLFFGSHSMKVDLEGEMLSILGMSAISAKDPLSIVFHQNQKLTLTPFSTQQKDFQLALDQFFSIDPKGETIPYSAITSYLMKTLRKKSLVIFIGDFFPSSPWDNKDFRPLAIKHDIVNIIVRDHLEEKPVAFQVSHFCDPTTYEKRQLFFDENMAHELHQKLIQHDHTITQQWNQWGIRNGKIMTHQSPLGVLTNLFLRS